MHVRLFATPWTVACQAPLSMEFCRQEYWSGLPFTSPGDLPDSGIKPKSPALAGRFFTTEPPGKLVTRYILTLISISINRSMHTSQGFAPWVRKIPWRSKWQLTPVFLPGKFHGQRSLEGYSLWGCKQLDIAEPEQI